MKFRLILIAIGLIAGIYSCSNSTENSDVLTKPTIEILASDPVPMQIKSIINVLGLAIEKPNPYINSPSDKEASILSAKEGVIIEYGYHDSEKGATYRFKIDEAESTKDNLVYYGDRVNDRLNNSSINDEETGPRYRKTISTTENGIMVKTELKRGDGYVPRGTQEYVENGNTIEEYDCKNNGTKIKEYIYKSNDKNSLIKEDPRTGDRYAVDNISIFQK